jgi:hypothetical protein
MALKLKFRSLLKLNMRLFTDMAFLREGAFFNIPSGTQFYDGSDMSVLLPDISADDTLFNISDGQVWQSPFRQWVYESGVPLDGTEVELSPALASGVFVEGSFRSPGDPEFGHTIDYINGRVIFNDPQPIGLKVNATFSYREVRLGFEHDFNQQFQRGFLESKYTTNPSTSMQIVYPSGFAQPFPAVFIEVDERDQEGYELGNRSAIIRERVKLHIWALDDIQRDNIVDVLMAQWEKNLPIIDFNIAPLPLSGIHNTLSFEYIPYQKLLANNVTVTTVGSGNPIRYQSYIVDARARNMPAAEEFERAMVTYEVETYLNQPNQILGTKFGPINRVGPADQIF